YLFKLFFPTALLGFLSPSVLLISTPVFIQNLLSSVESHTSIHFHYNALLIPFIFYSAINGFKKLLSCKIIYNYPLVLQIGFLAVLIISGVYLAGPQFYLKEFISFYCIDDIAKEKEKLVRMIPKDAPVIATFQFLPRLASRHNVYSMHFVASGFKMYTNIRYEPPKNLEYALIDFNEPLMINSFFPRAAPDNIRFFIKNANWGLLKAIDDIALFKKGFSGTDSLFKPIHNPKIQNIINANINNQIMFLGYNNISYFKKEGVLHLSYYWKFINNIDRPLGVFIYFLDSENKVRFQKFHTLGYRIYPAENWPKDEIVRENYYAFIPSYMEKGVYGIRLCLFYLDDRKILPVLDKDKIDSYGRIILGSISLN
ncbi:MAG: DUF2079 domain-containing protein, partial [Candidatus Omnitrophica bacterium]|nr:DUF2079 domain-containing protein [Candidatus Omnitrophota bacterium]